MLAPNGFRLSGGAQESNGLRAQSSPPPSETRYTGVRSNLADAYLLSPSAPPRPHAPPCTAVMSVFFSVQLGGHVLCGKSHPALKTRGGRDGALGAARFFSLAVCGPIFITLCGRPKTCQTCSRLSKDKAEAGGGMTE